MQTTILVLEDDFKTRERYRFTIPELLTEIKEPGELFLASNRLEASEILDTKNVEVMFCDLMLDGDPDGQRAGFKLAQQIKQGDFRSNPEIVFLTGFGGELNRLEANMSLGSLFVTKPVNKDKIASSIIEALRRFRKRQEKNLSLASL